MTTLPPLPSFTEAETELAAKKIQAHIVRIGKTYEQAVLEEGADDSKALQQAMIELLDCVMVELMAAITKPVILRMISDTVLPFLNALKEIADDDDAASEAS